VQNNLGHSSVGTTAIYLATERAPGLAPARATR